VDAARPRPQDRPAESWPQNPAIGGRSVASVSELKELLVERLARTLRVTPDRIPADAAFADLGVDAIAGMSFVSEVGDALGLPLDATVLYDHTTLDRLAGHLAEPAALRGSGVPPKSDPQPTGSEDEDR
jgi:acyl carrier protein